MAMTEPGSETTNAKGAARSNLPTYVNGQTRRDATAFFRTRAPLPVSRGRIRAYPNLSSEAPPTSAFYAALIAACPGAARVLDVGCGSGVGTLELASNFEHVLAADSDAASVDFARAYAPDAEYLVSDFNVPPAIEAVDCAIVSDVLNQASDPDTLLRSVRAVLGPTGTLLIAEPRAYSAQCLQSPVRQAFSERSLAALLTRSGFAIETWLARDSSFIVCLARPSQDDSWQVFAEAANLRAEGEFQSAITCLERVLKAAPVSVQVEALLQVAELYARLGDGDNAVRSYLRVSELEARESRSLVGLSMLALANGAKSDALELTIRALELDPCDASAAACLARAAEAMGQQTDALKAWNIAVALAPSDPTAAIELARGAAARENYRYGVSVLERLRSYHNELGVDFHVTLGWLFALAKHPSEARLEVRHALLLAPTDNGALELQAFLESGQAAA